MQFNNEISNGRCMYPFSQLSWINDNEHCAIVVFFPQACEVRVKSLETNELIAELAPQEHGLWMAKVTNKAQQNCRYTVVAMIDGTQYSYIDPYQFEQEAYHSVHFIDHAPENLYRQAGAQLRSTNDDIKGVSFSVYAPKASAVSVIGDFNQWDKLRHPMHKTDMGYWVLFVPSLEAGARYKYALKDSNGLAIEDKADPLGFSQEQYPSFASLVYDHKRYKWQNQAWQKQKENTNPYQSPMSIYEVHLGSWRSPNSDDKHLNYKDLAHQLVDYVSEMAYTHIEVLPISEFPFDGSWGYQPLALFAPTSRFGSPDEFKYFVDYCHLHNIGVIIDWVPAHFPEDDHGLAQFDGSCLYEYEDPKKGWHPDWNSCIYDFGKDYVRQFLVANALYWFDMFKVDGIRVDAVASMLYLDYSREEGEWVPNVDGGNHNYEAISLLQWMNTEVYGKHPQAITIAEESTSYAGVSRPVDSGGLGFGFKWNMGWMHDSLEYFSKDPAYRPYHHDELSFSMVYAYDENFVLPISHDEVVHGKKSMLQKMPGDEWQKFANLRAFYAYMFAHPGKKLQFMGNEFAQYHEWDHDTQLDWGCVEHGNQNHIGMQKLYRALNIAYQNESCLHALDHEQNGFQWIDLHNSEQSIFSFVRLNGQENEGIIVLANLSPQVYENFQLGVPFAGDYQVLLNTDDAEYSGSVFLQETRFISVDHAMHGMDHSLYLKIPPLATLFIKKM